MKIKLGVIFGGNSVEHEISIITAVQAMENIDEEKYEIIPIYISKDNYWYTGHMLKEIDVYKDFENLKRFAKKGVLIKTNEGFVFQSQGFFKRTVTDIDVAFPIVHGKNVEDGSLAGYLQMIGMPYVGSNILGASVGQDKVILKQVLEAEGLPVVPYVWFFDNDYYLNKKDITAKIKKLAYPIIIKPASLGSSVGIEIVKDEKDLEKSIMEVLKYDNKVIVEPLVKNLVEVNCAVVGDYQSQETSEIALMKSNNDFLTYNDKYIGQGKGSKKTGSVKMVQGKQNGSGSNIVIPAPLTQKLADEVKDLSKKTFKVLNLSGVARVDFLIDDKTKKVYINEPNTIPGSLSFYMFTPMGKDYKTLLDELVTLAIKNYKRETEKISSFDTNILSQFSGLGVKGMKGMKNKLK